MKTKNQQTQIIVFCCLAAVVLGLGVFKVVGGKSAPASHKQAGAVKQVAQAQPDEPSAAQQDHASPAATETTQGLAYKTRDPFVPQVIGASAQTRNQQGREAPLVSRVPKLPLPLIAPLHPQPIDFTPAGPSTAEFKPDPASELRLTGVIEGSCSVAIIRGEGGARYIVREGQSIEGKYILQSISRNGVHLKYGGKTYILRLGTPPARKSSS